MHPLEFICLLVGSTLDFSCSFEFKVQDLCAKGKTPVRILRAVNS
jgi:hypothetical protein